MSFTTYILFSHSIKKFYTGQTEDLEKRLEEHNRGKTPGMARGIPWIVVFSKEFATRSEAVRLENNIKNRGAKRFLIDNEWGELG